MGNTNANSVAYKYFTVVVHYCWFQIKIKKYVKFIPLGGCWPYHE